MLTLIWALPRGLQDLCALLSGANHTTASATSKRLWLAPSALLHPRTAACCSFSHLSRPLAPHTRGRGTEEEAQGECVSVRVDHEQRPFGACAKPLAD